MADGGKKRRNAGKPLPPNVSTPRGHFVQNIRVLTYALR